MVAFQACINYSSEIKALVTFQDYYLLVIIQENYVLTSRLDLSSVQTNSTLKKYL